MTFGEGWPVFRGHLPGKPIVPGAEIVRLAAELTGEQLAGVERFKFHQAIGPGDTVTFGVERDGDVWRVRVERDGELCAAGIIRTYL